jgi:hypothetical protein
MSISFGQEIYDLDKPKTEQQLIGKSVKTKDIAIYKTVKYPVYKTEKGKLFIVFLNKKGTYSKKYVN